LRRIIAVRTAAGRSAAAMRRIRNYDWIVGAARRKLRLSALQTHVQKASKMSFSTALPRDYWIGLPDHLAEGSLWMRIAFVALSVFASSVVVLANGQARPFAAVAWALGSGAAALWSLRRSLAVIRREEARIESEAIRRAV
jgi:hypothetical protein